MKIFKKKTTAEKAYKQNNKTSSKYYSILKRAEEIAEEVLRIANEIDPSDSQIKEKTKELRDKVSKGDSLDSVLIDAFVNAYKAIQKIYGISLYKVQIMGGYALHLGDIAEMRTGEGKTLTAILPAYLNSLTGNGVHVVTVNEYLSQRDAFNTGRVFSLLNLTTGSVTSEQNPRDKKIEYAKDITYVTNSELGFDYLRDNMVQDFLEKSQRGFNYAIVDEVDSILIDEARTPLIISQGNIISEQLYLDVDKFVKGLSLEDYEKDNETKTVYLNDLGVIKAQDFFNTENLYSYKNSQLVHRIFNALQANYIYEFDVDYTVKEDEIILIDIFTGRLLPGRSFSEGLNQAIEAKEGVKIKPETKTIASITYQNLFRMYSKLSGMTGTAFTEEEEFINIYNMRVISIPTNVPIIRNDLPDLIFASKTAKFESAIKKIQELNSIGQPILVGTKSVYDSELVSNKLKDLNLTHEVLNAKNNAREAEIISRAGELNSITISTNMAGRGTDIKISDESLEKGGLFVIGTERYESRRIDNQLRGRSGRQGDIGSSQFYVSLEDEIMLRAGLKRIQRFMGSLDNSPIESSFITKSITISQKKIEGINYDQRKTVVEYDDVLNRQRLIVYKQRDNILLSKDILRTFNSFIESFSNQLVLETKFFDDGILSISKLKIYLIEGILKDSNAKIDELDKLTDSALISRWILNAILELINESLEKADKELIKNIVRKNMISILDMNWQNQIDNLTRLRSGIHYRQYAQQNPVQVYILEANEMFEEFKWDILEQSVAIIVNFISHFSTRVVNDKSRVKPIIESKQEKVKELIVG